MITNDVAFEFLSLACLLDKRGKFSPDSLSRMKHIFSAARD